MSKTFNPFPGLRSFRIDEKYLFFGRENHTAELLRRLRETRFLGVVGTSGSGKSSLVKAGVLPELHKGTMTRAGSSWEVAVMRPGGSPMTNLALALIEADLYDSDQPDVVEQVRATLSRSRQGLSEAARQSDLEEGANLLVVIDQFEELFRFRRSGAAEDRAEAIRFVQLLLSASAEACPAIYVVLTMRSDYLGDCTAFPGLAEAVNAAEYLIPRMDRGQRRSAIEGPVKVAGATMTPRLLQKLLNDLGDDPDQLPILQHALMRTWNRWEAAGAEAEPLDLPHYEGVGGMRDALSRHADEVYAELVDDRHRLVAARIFKALTERGSEDRGIRRPTRLARLEEIADATKEEVRAVVEAFRAPGRTFLMPPVDSDLEADTVIDISHESLMRVWQRLRDWTSEEERSASIYRRLEHTARLWKEGEAGLYQDPDLQIAEHWFEDAAPNKTWAAQYGGGFDTAAAFLEESHKAGVAAEEDKEAARQRELEQAKVLAEAERLRAEEQQLRAEQQKRAAIRLRWLLVGSLTMGVAALVAFIFAQRAEQR
ncbi:MAG: nSTAND1 domain-containing NTPase, partial [Planctomycetota bacterium]